MSIKFPKLAVVALGLSLLLPLLGSAALIPRAHAAESNDVFYTTSGAGTGLADGAELFKIDVSGSKITTQDIGPTHGGDCASMAISPSGMLYSMCGPLFEAQQLAIIDQKTG